jgi:DNA-binding NarL/FixJ family response regulator
MAILDAQKVWQDARNSMPSADRTLHAAQGGGMVTQVMIVEDDSAFLNRCCRIVTSEPQFALFAAVRNGASARESLAHGAPDVILVDLGLPDMSGIDIIREATLRYPLTDVMVITMFGDEAHVLESIGAGATGYVLKDSMPDELIDLIKQLRAGGSPISPVIARLLLKKLRSPQTPAAAGVHESGLSALSARESEILAMIAKGFSFAEIGKLLAVSTHTVTTHVKNIYRKLAVHSRGEAVYEATKMGLL